MALAEQIDSPTRASDRAGLLGAFLAVCIWGLVPVAIRYFLQSVDAITFSTIRFAAMAVLGLPLFLWAAPWRWPVNDIVRLAFCALLAIPGLNIPNTLSARTIPAGGVGLLTSTEPIFIVLLSLLVARGGVSLRVILGAVIALLGVALALSTRASTLIDTANLDGELWGLLGSASWAGYAVFGATLARRYGSVSFTGGVLVVGGALGAAGLVPFVPVSAWPPALTFVEITTMALGSSVTGFLLWNFGASRMKPAPLGLMLYFLPIVSLVGGRLVLAETLTVREVIGGLIILFGVAFGEGRLRLIKL